MHDRCLYVAFMLPLIRLCFPIAAPLPPSGGDWLHEIKHDGYRIIARRDGDALRLLTQDGDDLSERFPMMTDALQGLPAKSVLIDGEAVVCDSNGVAQFDLLSDGGRDGEAFLYAFDLLEVNG